jgi:hypothetical protein
MQTLPYYHGALTWIWTLLSASTADDLSVLEAIYRVVRDVYSDHRLGGDCSGVSPMSILMSMSVLMPMSMLMVLEPKVHCSQSVDCDPWMIMPKQEILAIVPESAIRNGQRSRCD